MRTGSQPPNDRGRGGRYGVLEGTLERITYLNEETNYVVARLEVPGRRELATVVGPLATVSPGETLRLHGEWISHKRYGEQFRVDRYDTVAPATLTAIEKYLGSGLIKGIGPVFAKRLVGAFGLDTLQVIEETPQRLTEVDGIGPVRLARITQAWVAQKHIREVMLFLQGHGVSATYAVKIYKAYGHDAIRIVQDNPYRLAQDIYGIGFKTADRIAAGLGVPKDSPVRAEAGLVHVLHEMTDEGHVYYPEAALLEAAAAILEVEASLLADALARLETADRVVRVPILQEGHTAVYVKPLHLAEVGIARRLRDLARAPRIPYPIDVERAIAWAEARHHLKLAPLQREAIRGAVAHKVLVLTGGPGTGKTTILRCIIDILERKQQRILCCSPTGRAAKRMAEATGREAQTIHRLLEFDPRQGGFKRTAERPLEVDLLIVDEASMIDVPLMHGLLRAVPLQATLLLVGDADQLPSVGPGLVLRDLIASGALPVVALNEIFRQAEASQIVVNAHRVNQGQLPNWGDGEIPQRPSPGPGPRSAVRDFAFLGAEEPEGVQALILDLASRRLPAALGFDPLEQIQVLTPMQRGPIGAQQLNAALQSALNPPGETAEVTRGARTFRTGDRVMQIRNNYEKEVFNGDIGRVARVDLEEQEIRVRFDGREIAYDFGELDELVLAYAITVHKSQGSEYPVVILPVHTTHFVMLQRNLLYTALTRARRLAILVGTRKAVAIAVRTVRTERRFSNLRRWLAQGVTESHGLSNFKATLFGPAPEAPA